MATQEHITESGQETSSKDEPDSPDFKRESTLVPTEVLLFYLIHQTLINVPYVLNTVMYLLRVLH